MSAPEVSTIDQHLYSVVVYHPIQGHVIQFPAKDEAAAWKRADNEIARGNVADVEVAHIHTETTMTRERLTR